MTAATIDIVRRIMRGTGFDEDSNEVVLPNDTGTELSFSTREHGDIVEERPGREDVLAARALRDQIHKLVPGVAATIDTCDEWVSVTVRDRVTTEVRP